MILELTRPLVCLDVETHDKGSPEQVRIVELGFKKLYVDGREPYRYVSFVDPGVPITAGATEVHHITDDMVVNAPQFNQLAPSLLKGFRDCDYCGYNVRFDLRVIAAEFLRVGIEWSPGDAKLLDSMHLWRVGQPRTLSDAVREFLKREPTEAHRALGDAEDALDVALAQLERFQLPHTIAELHALCYDDNHVDSEGKFVWINGEVACNFGRHRRTLLKSMPVEYLDWMVRKGDFSTEVKKLVANALSGVYPTK